MSISPETLKTLQVYSWPGNVRELENVIQRAVALNQGDVILPGHLPEFDHSKQHASSGLKITIPEEGLDLEQLEIELLKSALLRTNGNQTRAAHLLGLTRPALIYRIEKFSLR